MIQTKRTESNTSSYYQNTSSVAVLDRPVENTAVQAPVQEETIEQANIRMRENLQKLLNYDRYEAIQDSVVVEETPVEEVAVVVETTTDCLDEDIRPTSTTMQFGDDADTDIRNEVKTGATEQTKTFGLSKKGKVIIALYSVVVALIFALIIVNSAVLSSLRSDIAAKEAQLSAITNEYQLSESRLQELENQVAEKAEELGMIK